MSSPNTRKAALLLASLDPQSAAELLKAAKPETVTEIAAELVYLDVAGRNWSLQEHEPVREFAGLLARRQTSRTEDSFVRRVLESAVGKRKSEEVFGQARRLVDERDPFLSIRSAEVEELAAALAGEHPQVSALVLMELPPDRSAQLLALLEESVRPEAVRRMTSGDTVSAEAKLRVAAMIKSRLDAARAAASRPASPGAPAPAAKKASKQPDAHLRHLAILLRRLKTEMRDGLVKAIADSKPDVAATIQNLMVTWQDMPLVSDRSLQEVLRNVEAQKLALALWEADHAVVSKVRTNVSERARLMIDEEQQLMKKPKAEDIEAAREEILGYLRQLNATGQLEFEEK